MGVSCQAFTASQVLTMIRQQAHISEMTATGFVAATARGALQLTWHAIRLPFLALLIVMEPFVCAICSGIAVLGVVFAVFFEYLVRLPNFPFLLMMGLSAGFALLLFPYYALIRIFSTH
jgi:hypothetical protein